MLKLVCSFVVSLIEVWRIISRFRPDLVHTNTALILTPGVVAKFRRIPHIWHIREVFADFTGLWRWYQWYITLLSSRIVCVSNAVAEQFSSGVPPEKICILHNGLPSEEFSEVSLDRVRGFRNRYNLDSHLLVGLVGRIKIERKGQDVFLHAAAALKPRFPNARFLFIGSPFPGNEAHLSELQNLIKQLKLSHEVVYTGDVEDIESAYAALDISVQPSVLPEAFSGVVIESMAMGKAVVASSCGGTKEQIENQVTGILVDPGNSEQLASVLDSLLRDAALRKRLGDAARQRFLECFEFETFYQKVTELYRSLLVPTPP